MSNPTTFLDVGFHDNVPAAVYHADPCPTPSLSSGIARTILSQSVTHAYHKHPRLGGKKEASTASQSFGSIVHGLMDDIEKSDFVLGTYDNYRSGAAQAWRDSVTASGKMPVLERDLDDARPVAAALKEKAALGCSNSPFVAHGKSEVTGIWKEGDVFCRARYDRLVIDPNGFADVWDWKTTTDCSPEALRKTIEDEGYHIQAAFYLRGLAKLLPAYAGRMSFILVFVEKTAPYAVRRVCLNGKFMQLADIEVGRAIRKWQHALAENDWSFPSAETLTLEPSPWLERHVLEAVL